MSPGSNRGDHPGRSGPSWPSGLLTLGPFQLENLFTKIMMRPRTGMFWVARLLLCFVMKLLVFNPFLIPYWAFQSLRPKVWRNTILPWLFEYLEREDWCMAGSLDWGGSRHDSLPSLKKKHHFVWDHFTFYFWQLNINRVATISGCFYGTLTICGTVVDTKTNTTKPAKSTKGQKGPSREPARTPWNPLCPSWALLLRQNGVR